MSRLKTRNQQPEMPTSCDELQESLSLYADDGLAPDARGACYRHLEVCPVCRARLAEMRPIRSSLAMLSRPSPPDDLVPALHPRTIWSPPSTRPWWPPPQRKGPVMTIRSLM